MEPFSPEEDAKILHHVKRFGPLRWDVLAARLKKGGRSLFAGRDRWTHYLDPEVSRAPWSRLEDKFIIEAQKKVRNHWSEIAATHHERTGILRPPRKLKERCNYLCKNTIDNKVAHTITEEAKKGVQIGSLSQKVILPLPKEPGQFVGNYIEKDFGPLVGRFRGKITGFDKEASTGRILYSVTYEDGDEEDLYQEEAALLLAPIL